MNVNLNELKSWIGNEETTFDDVTKSLETRFRATLDIDPGNPKNGEIASSGLHWALGPAVVKSSLLGKDSHPKKGDFLPPVPLPRRMWAGCRTHFFHSLKIGDQVKKISKVVDINLKNGKSGMLCFVTAKYQFLVKDKLMIEEEHDLVYRDIEKTKNNMIIKNDLPFEKADYEEKIFTHPTMLFRYSAITFNGHRIHYDYKYSKEEENYKDLVFHGPLQATLLLRASEKLANKKAKKFIHKGTAPVFANENLKIKATCSNENEITSFASTDESGMTMKGSAEF